MNFRHMEVFSAIAKTGSITGAARLLQVSQPNITRVLNHAEQRLGFALFERRRKGLIPTPEARLLLSDVGEVMRQMESVDDRIARLRQGGGQRLRIGTVPALAQSLMPTTLIEIHRQFPDLIIELVTLHFDTVCKRLVDHQIDVALVFAQQAPAQIRREILFCGNLVAVIPRSIPPPAEKVTLNWLVTNNLLLIPIQDPLGEVLAKALIRSELPTQSAYRIKTYSVLADLVAAGAGVAVVDPFTAARYRDRLHVAAIQPDLPFDVALLSHREAPLSAAGALLQSILRSRVQNGPMDFIPAVTPVK